jgi:hypothetical protein
VKPGSNQRSSRDSRPEYILNAIRLFQAHSPASDECNQTGTLGGNSEVGSMTGEEIKIPRKSTRSPAAEHCNSSFLCGPMLSTPADGSAGKVHLWNDDVKNRIHTEAVSISITYTFREKLPNSISCGSRGSPRLAFRTLLPA